MPEVADYSDGRQFVRKPSIYNEVTRQRTRAARELQESDRMSKLSNSRLLRRREARRPARKQYLSASVRDLDNDSAANQLEPGTRPRPREDVAKSHRDGQHLAVADEKNAGSAQRGSADNHSEKGVCEISYNLNFISRLSRKSRTKSREEE